MSVFSFAKWRCNYTDECQSSKEVDPSAVAASTRKIRWNGFIFKHDLFSVERHFFENSGDILYGIDDDFIDSLIMYDVFELSFDFFYYQFIFAGRLEFQCILESSVGAVLY